MELYIGGFAQGKLTYVQEKYTDKITTVIDENKENVLQTLVELSTKEPVIVVNHLHLIIRSMMQQNMEICPLMEQLKELEKYNNKLVIICDEVGNGIIPMDAFEREYREMVGRCAIQIAKEATKVERIICGMGQVIKER